MIRNFTGLLSLEYSRRSTLKSPFIAFYRQSRIAIVCKINIKTFVCQGFVGSKRNHKVLLCLCPCHDRFIKHFIVSIVLNNIGLTVSGNLNPDPSVTGMSLKIVLNTDIGFPIAPNGIIRMMNKMLVRPITAVHPIRSTSDNLSRFHRCNIPAGTLANQRSTVSLQTQRQSVINIIPYSVSVTVNIQNCPGIVAGTFEIRYIHIHNFIRIQKLECQTHIFFRQIRTGYKCSIFKRKLQILHRSCFIMGCCFTVYFQHNFFIPSQFGNQGQSFSQSIKRIIGPGL